MIVAMVRKFICQSAVLAFAITSCEIYAQAQVSKELRVATYEMSQASKYYYRCMMTKQGLQFATCNSSNPDDPCIYQIFLGAMLATSYIAFLPFKNISFSTGLSSDVEFMVEGEKCIVSESETPDLFYINFLVRNNEVASDSFCLVKIEEYTESVKTLFSELKKQNQCDVLRFHAGDSEPGPMLTNPPNVM